MGLLISDPPLLVLVEMVPGILEVGVHVGWDLSWLELVSGLEDGSGGDLTVRLHEKLLSGLVARWGSSLLGESGEHVVHDLVLVGTVVAGEVLLLPGLSSGNILSIWVRVVSDLDSLDGAEKSSNG